MPPSNHAVSECFAALTTAGIAPPSAWTSAEAGPKRQSAIAATRATWQIVLDDLTDIELREVVVLHLRESQWWPRPAELRAIADRFRPRSEARAIATGDEAWGRALELVGRHGVYAGQPARLSDVDEEHEALAGAIRSVGGWQRLCGARLDDMQVRAAFARAYEAHRERQREGAEHARRIEAAPPALLRRLLGGHSGLVEGPRGGSEGQGATSGGRGALPGPGGPFLGPGGDEGSD